MGRDGAVKGPLPPGRGAVARCWPETPLRCYSLEAVFA